MNTSAPERTAMTAPNTLFEVEDDRDAPKPAPASLFADIVFDRPLDHAYTYAVPDHLTAKIGVGKRVEVPFGKGGKPTAGFCVRVTDVPPNSGYEMKAVTRVLDDDAIVDDHLMKLTRWMADYYLCGWGQVLHAVVPAGVRDNAGTRNVVFVEPVAKDDLPDPLPTVTPKQKQALERLRKEGQPMELTLLARQLGCGPSPITGLVGKGLVRKFAERVERLPSGLVELEDGADEPFRSPDITLNADQELAWVPVHEAVQAGGFKPFLLHGVTGS